MGVEVRPIRFPDEARAFVDTWWTVYRGDPCWVPPLVSEQLRFLDPGKNPYFQVATIQPFLATKDGRPAGTLACTVDHYLKKHEPGVGLFGFFEFVNDPEVARSLFEAGTAWLRDQGVYVVRGPFNFNPNHEFGLRYDRFDDLPTVGNPHAGWWYPAIYEKHLGLEKVRDWYAYWYGYGPTPRGMKAISDRFTSRHPQFRIRKMDAANFWRDCEQFWEIYNDAWEHNWGHVYMEKAEFLDKARGLQQILDPEFAFFAMMGDEIAGAAISLPDYNQVAKRMNGGLFPLGWAHYLNRANYIDRVRVLVLGIKKKFQHLPLGAPLYVETWEVAYRRGLYRGVEASLILEDNHRMRGALEKLGGTISGTWRTFQKGIGPVPEGATVAPPPLQPTE